MKAMTTVFAIGRWMPIHLGHKAFLVKLAKQFDRLVIGIGSCYENGTPRNCIPAVEREKLLRIMLKSEGITNAVIIPIQDRPTFDQWIDDVCRVCEVYGVTHFCTGNKKDILDVLEAKGIKLDVEMINPEEESEFPFHATDIRNAILSGEWDKLDGMIPTEIKPMVVDQIAREIERASRGEGQEFIPGRQTVDLVFFLKESANQKTYVLLGKRNMKKVDFPGVWALPGDAIREFESPIDASIRCFLDESGISLTLEDNASEPARVTVNTFGGLRTGLHFIGIYASPDERINGTRGGGSQCFALLAEGKREEVAPLLHAIKDMDELALVDVDTVHGMTLAYDQKHMLLDALHRLGIAYDNGEELAVFGEDTVPSGEGVLRSYAHETGVLHGASHTYITKTVDGKRYFLLQRRAACKDSFPGCLDISSAGHVEKGSDFIKTAEKELFEELGLTVPRESFRRLFTQTVRHEGEFHGKRFLDCEVNCVFLLSIDPPLSSIRLQEGEVSEVVWLSEDEILSRMASGDPAICLDPDEFDRVIRALL